MVTYSFNAKGEARMRVKSLFLIAFSMLFGTRALADEQLQPLAAQGDWIAMAHEVSMTDAPDVCIAAEVTDGGFALRHDSYSTEAIIVDRSWSLPANVAGQIKISVGSMKLDLTIDTNDNISVRAPVEHKDLANLIAAMETASSMTVVAGNGHAKQISLNGSKVALTAFLTCSGMNAPSNNTGGENPFATPPKS